MQNNREIQIYRSKQIKVNRTNKIYNLIQTFTVRRFLIVLPNEKISNEVSALIFSPALRARQISGAAYPSVPQGSTSLSALHSVSRSRSFTHFLDVTPILSAKRNKN